MQNNGSTWYQTSYNSGTNSWSVSNTALTGNVKNIYIDKTNNEGYYWNPATSQFVKIGPTIYSWALASTKPTYTASEVGAMATTHPANAITSTDIENWDDKADKIIVSRDVSSSGSISRTIQPGKFYIFPTLTGLTLTLGTGQGFLIYGGKFTAASSGCTLTLPSGTTVAPGCPSIEGGNTYEFNILDGSLILA
ncbi:hypothetical protein [Lachnospira sp.]|jgi:hypothetical protein|uniref:hypothetical protein n=1 Tax=Lachnospira sp. TaxID=2049031 RepID=UPI00257DE457|nr:hypothetical protein [Lachnospira sp.]